VLKFSLRRGAEHKEVASLPYVQVNELHQQCQQDNANAFTTPLRAWLLRTQRMYQAAGQANSTRPRTPSGALENTFPQIFDPSV
jgi:hypothetical protein